LPEISHGIATKLSRRIGGSCLDTPKNRVLAFSPFMKANQTVRFSFVLFSAAHRNTTLRLTDFFSLLEPKDESRHHGLARDIAERLA